MGGFTVLYIFKKCSFSLNITALSLTVIKKLLEVRFCTYSVKVTGFEPTNSSFKYHHPYDWAIVNRIKHKRFDCTAITDSVRYTYVSEWIDGWTDGWVHCRADLLMGRCHTDAFARTATHTHTRTRTLTRSRTISIVGRVSPCFGFRATRRPREAHPSVSHPDAVHCAMISY